VVAHVPGIQGEWSGSAEIQSVNNRKNPVPKIDLHLSFFEDPAIPGLVRGYMDSYNSLLWPVDVPLIGHITDRSGNAFYLNGAYVLRQATRTILLMTSSTRGQMVRTSTGIATAFSMTSTRSRSLSTGL
jgi:hypothetical protein